MQNLEEVKDECCGSGNCATEKSETGCGCECEKEIAASEEVDV